MVSFWRGSATLLTLAHLDPGFGILLLHMCAPPWRRAPRRGGGMVFRTFTLPRRPKKIAPPSRRAAAVANAAAAFTLPILLGKGTDTPVTLDHVSD